MGTDRIIYVVDDDPAVRRSLERLLSASDFQVVSYATAQAFLDVAASLPAGCALLDVRMPQMNGLEVQRKLHTVNADLPVIVITGQADIQSAVGAMKGGALDFIEKPYSDDVLISAIEAALSGPMRNATTGEMAAAASRIAELSPRERQVLDRLVSGQPNKAIAFDLGISVRTVEVHRARMMSRLGVRQFAEAVRISVLAKLAHES
jgi:two-component system response regulator FixJ